MSRDIELLRILNTILRTARQSESVCGGAAETLASFTDGAALHQIVTQTQHGIDVLSRGESEAASVAMTDEAPQSSVEIESRVKGPPRIQVKVYDRVPSQAAARSMALYRDIMGSFLEGSERTNGEVASHA